MLLCFLAINCPHFFSGSALCNFPCEWLGKTFTMEDQLGRFDIVSNMSLTFSEFNSSEASTAFLDFTLGLTCIQIDGSHLLLK